MLDLWLFRECREDNPKVGHDFHTECGRKLGLMSVVRFLTDVRKLSDIFLWTFNKLFKFYFQDSSLLVKTEEKVTQTSFLILSINILQLIVQGYLHQSAPLHQRIIVHIHIPCHQPTKHSSIINQNKHCRDTQGKTWLASLFTTDTQASILHSLSFINW